VASATHGPAGPSMMFTTPTRPLAGMSPTLVIIFLFFCFARLRHYVWPDDTSPLSDMEYFLLYAACTVQALCVWSGSHCIYWRAKQDQAFGTGYSAKSGYSNFVHLCVVCSVVASTYITYYWVGRRLLPRQKGLTALCCHERGAL
jgi:hypothetical protein